MRRPQSTIRPKARFRVLTRDNYRCRYCGRSAPSVIVHVDHIIPACEGGVTDDSNLVTACLDCNLGKGGSLLPISGTFLLYLRMQAGRDDPVGDLADDEARSPLTIEPSSYRDLAAALRQRSARPEAIATAWEAWREWQRGGRKSAWIRRIEAENRHHAFAKGGSLWLKVGRWAEGTFYPYSSVS